MKTPDIQYINKVNLLTQWISDINKMYFSYKNKIAVSESTIKRWNSISYKDKQDIVDAVFTVKISPFYGCASRYISVSPPCYRKKNNTVNGFADCADGIVADIEASCRQTYAPDYCRKMFLPYVDSNTPCSDIKIKSLDQFISWLLNASNSNLTIGVDFIQSRYMSDSLPKSTRWK